MVERAWVGGLVALLTGLGTLSTARAEDAHLPSPPPVILTLPGRPIESPDKAMTEAIRDHPGSEAIHGPRVGPSA